MEFSRLGAVETLALLKSRASGLELKEVAERQLQFGPNQIPDRFKASLFKRMIEPFRSAFVFVLGIGGAISWLIGHQNDAIVIMIVIGANALIEWSQQVSASRVLASLRQLSAKMIKVRRNKTVVEIDSIGLVPGDVMLLAEGEKIPADGRLLEAHDLIINESALTGESRSVAKNTDALEGTRPIYSQSNMVFAGTLVESGQAVVAVTATGEASEFGRIAALAARPSDRPPILTKIKALTLRLVVGSLAIAVLAISLGVAAGGDPIELVRFGVALVVSIIPEGLPVTLSIILLLGVQRMAKKRAFVRNLPAVETLGMVTAIATDKTGTLTQNQMTIAGFWDLDGSLSRDDNTDLWLSVSHARPDLVHPIEKLLTKFSEERGAPEGWHEVDSLGFDAQRRLTTVVWSSHKEARVYVKGAAEAILPYCRLSQKQRTQVEEKLKQMSGGNMRVIAVAKKSLDKPPADLKTWQPADLDFEGLVGFGDQLRPAAAQAVAQTLRAGIKVYMLTGDHRVTAGAIGRQVGILGPGHTVLEGEELVKSRSWAPLLKRTRVFARVLPEHKFRILEALKKTEIAAMTGDGVNDAPALAKADVGVAMGSGTDVAKEAADIVLLDDNYQTIVEAVREGRRIYANVRKIILYQISTNLAEAAVVVGGLALGLPLVMTAAQVLWLNLVTDTTMIIPLGVEAAEPRQMQTPPRSPKESLLSRHLLSRLIFGVVTMAAASLLVFNYYLDDGVETARTMAFLSLCAGQWAAGFSTRSEHRYSWWGFIKPRHYLWLGIGVGAILISLAIWGPLQNYIGTVSIPAKELLILIPVGLATMGAFDLHKWWTRRQA